MKIKDDLLFNIEEDGLKIREFLKKENISTRFIISSIKAENIYLNNKRCLKNEKLKRGDILKIKFQEENYNGLVQHKKLDIIYEDKDIIVINKEPHMVTHTAKDDADETLLNYLLGYFEEIGLKRKVRFINRLDRDTSGLIVAAKNPFAQAEISKNFENVVKEYVAIVKGEPEKEEGYIKLPIGISEDGIRRMVREDGQRAKTYYKKIKTKEGVSLLNLRLYTGRTHQIRVHLKAIGNPILGDNLYGEETNLINRQALHCYRMELITPRKKEIIKLKAEIPEDMRKLID